MTIRRFFIDKIINDKVILVGQQHNHLRKSLRLKVGNSIELFDSNGQAYRGIISEVNKNDSKVNLVSMITSAPEDQQIESKSTGDISFPIDVATSIPKISRADWMIEKLNEIGTRSLYLLETEYSKSSAQSTISENKLDRFHRIVIESSKQSKNNRLMNICPVSSFSDFIQLQVISQRKWDHLFLGDPSGMDLPEIFKSISSKSTTKLDTNKMNRILILIGPEGGFSQKELTQLDKLLQEPTSSVVQLHKMKLGNHILRMETAAILSSGLVNIQYPYLFNNK
ncbi:hypothetical protein DLAC_04622 [Tieghemostelium lacteum]|uniref:16S rRNA (uracil(1498)-N(3))-methyltransferase n=1 Tax=Tieghemostelium lacteum TaxID=361077 RepID=A0A151ZK19_TIELA|nr:hypothetical protein DLAC_04622 [Tieghemostelium lacteum]|eukprot:KYQ94323.1 hypothetical protein DLAC_04622 [Tieghemostelium lacteum]